MAHNNHVIDGFNKDVGMLDYDTAKDHFLSLAENWEDPNPDPIITEHEGVKVLRDDLITGTKVRGGDLLISKAPSDTIVYVQPRVGLAGVSILDVAKRYDKKVKEADKKNKEALQQKVVAQQKAAEQQEREFKDNLKS